MEERGRPAACDEKRVVFASCSSHGHAAQTRSSSHSKKALHEAMNFRIAAEILLKARGILHAQANSRLGATSEKASEIAREARGAARAERWGGDILQFVSRLIQLSSPRLGDPAAKPRACSSIGI